MSFLGGISLATGALTHKAPVIVSIGGKGVVIQRPQLWLRTTGATARKDLYAVTESGANKTLAHTFWEMSNCSESR